MIGGKDCFFFKFFEPWGTPCGHKIPFLLCVSCDLCGQIYTCLSFSWFGFIAIGLLLEQKAREQGCSRYFGKEEEALMHAACPTQLTARLRMAEGPDLGYSVANRGSFVLG